MVAEGVVHATRSYLADLSLDHVMLKLDYKNAFNSIRRDVILRETLAKLPQVYPLLTQLTDIHPFSSLEKILSSQLRAYNRETPPFLPWDSQAYYFPPV